jgi:beta-xylosidase
MKLKVCQSFTVLLSFLFVFFSCSKKVKPKSGNPIIEGWYADPEGVVFGHEYWIHPTWSDGFDKQVFFDAFSSTDLINWEKHSNIIDTTSVSWAIHAMWAPSAIEEDGKYYLFFGANDLQVPGSNWYDENKTQHHYGGIGIAFADSPGGPFKDYLGKPLIDDVFNGAQLIVQFVYKDANGTYYMFYGGWGKCNLVKLNNYFDGLIPWDDGTIYKDVTPEGYVEGPVLFQRNGKYYFQWSEGGWTNGTYKVAYAIADNITRPFNRIGIILESEESVATGAGHNSVINIQGVDDWHMVYHRRPIPKEDRDHRVACIDKMEFNEDGTIKPIKITFERVSFK